MSAHAAAPRRITSFFWKRLFSAMGLIPLGAYVIAHLYNNLASLQGADAFNRHLSESRSLPFIVPITVLVIWVPIAFHGLYGLAVMREGRPNLRRDHHFETIKYVLQRLSGVGLLLFVPAHVYKTRIEPYLHGQSLDFAHMREGLSEADTLIIYGLGVLGVAFHLANGVWQASIGFGLTTTVQAMRRMQTLSLVLFATLAAMGYAAVWGFIR